MSINKILSYFLLYLYTPILSSTDQFALANVRISLMENLRTHKLCSSVRLNISVHRISYTRIRAF